MADLTEAQRAALDQIEAGVQAWITANPDPDAAHGLVTGWAVVSQLMPTEAGTASDESALDIAAPEHLTVIHQIGLLRAACVTVEDWIRRAVR